MRLTLRTLLSYLDNVLDEPSRKALEEQIGKGENASEWVHRTRDVMRRLKLGAPEVHGSGSVDDPNTVAEYLDRTLPEEGVAEFERVCLESDVMLAEVASCHHVLAMVLTETAAIDPDTRKRLHRLQDDLAIAMKSRIEGGHPLPEEAVSSAAEAAPTASETPVARRTKPEPVPSYLQEPSPNGWMRWAPALAALLLLAVTAGLAFGPGGWFSPPAEVAKSEVEEPAKGGNGAVLGEEKEPEVDATASEQVPSIAAEESPSTVVETDPVAEETGKVDSEEEATSEAGETANGDLVIDEAVDAETVEENGEPASDESSGEAASSGEGTDELVVTPADEGTGNPDAAADEPEVTPTLTSLSGPEQLAAFLGPDASWQRLQRGLTTSEESRLICLPTYRSAVGVAGEFVVEMVGLTDVIINPQTPSVALSHGRIILSRGAEAEGPITVELVLLEKPERHSYQIELSPGSVVAIAADRVADPGHPVLQASPPLAALSQVIVAPVGYSRTPGDAAKKTEPGALFTRGRFQQMPNDYGDMEWVSKLSVSVPDEYARPMLAQDIAFGTPVLGQALITAREFDLAEVRSLAARCCLALGDAAPVARSFQNEADARYWPVHFAALRQAASRSIAAANQVLRGFVVSHGDNGGAALFELVAGFATDQVGVTPAELQLGVVQAKLVGIGSDDEPGLLDSKDLPTRVLASLALDELVVQEGQPYDPSARLRQRDKSLRLLRQALDREVLQPKRR